MPRMYAVVALEIAPAKAAEKTRQKVSEDIFDSLIKRKYLAVEDVTVYEEDQPEAKECIRLIDNVFPGAFR